MCIGLKKKNEDNIEKIEECVSRIIDGFPNLSRYNQKVEFGKQNLYHYTSFDKLFSILDNDSFWASRSRFSNDSTEGILIGEELIKKAQYYGDNYILSFCREGDILSQWRGYCPYGGVSIELEFPTGASTYTLLHSDCRDSEGFYNNVELYKNRAIPVIYCKSENSNAPGIDIDNVIKLFDEPDIKNTGKELYDIIPYLKNGYFFEEEELRLVFNNTNGELEKCIRFRKLDDGSMVPYIVLKYGDLQKMGQDLSISYTEQYINYLFEEKLESYDRSAIIVPCGRNQSQIYSEFSKKIRDYKRKIYNDASLIDKQKKWEKYPVNLLCDGHLPVVSITISPSKNQEYMKEVVERFCKGKYWLQNIEVKCSKIPYISTKL